MKRAQSAAEFVVLASAMFLSFCLVFIYLESMLVDYSESAKLSSVTAIQAAVVGEFELADKMPTGYERKFTIPETINGIAYTITLENETTPLKDAVLISLTGVNNVRFIEQDVNGTLRSGENTIVKTTIIQIN